MARWKERDYAESARWEAQRKQQVYQHYRQGERGEYCNAPTETNTSQHILQPTSPAVTPTGTPTPPVPNLLDDIRPPFYHEGHKGDETSICPLPTPKPEFIGPAPTPTATPTPPATPPAISGEDVARGICDVANAVDPVLPNPATLGGPNIGDMIDQAYVWQQSVPRISPPFEIIVRVPIMMAKVFKDGPSTVVNFICQQRDGAGPYYELFPIDRKVQSVKNWWNEMDIKQKIFVAGFTVLALLIAIPAIVILFG
ncbi:MAG: hypothetical protein ACK8QZ_08745, partial [Anaerolineales bacterium]